MSYRESKLYPLPHSLAVAGDATVSSVGHVNMLDCLPRLFFCFAFVAPVQAQYRRNQSKTGHAFRKRVELRAVPDLAVKAFRVILCGPQDRGLAASLSEQSRHQVHQRCLAGAIRAHEARDSRTDLQVVLVDAQDLAVELRYIAKHNPVRFGCHRTTS